MRCPSLWLRNGQNGAQTSFLSSALVFKEICHLFLCLPFFLVIPSSDTAPPAPRHHLVWKTCSMALFLLHYFGVFLGLILMVVIFQSPLACHLNPAIQMSILQCLCCTSVCLTPSSRPPNPVLKPIINFGFQSLSLLQAWHCVVVYK